MAAARPEARGSALGGRRGGEVVPESPGTCPLNVTLRELTCYFTVFLCLSSLEIPCS